MLPSEIAELREEEALAIIEADRAAVALNAKRELLNEIANLAHKKSHAEAAPTYEVHTAAAVRELQAKYEELEWMSPVELRRRIFDCVENASHKATWHYSVALELIEQRDAARDKAVALRVLDEIVVAWSNQPLGSKRPFLDAIDELRAKYQEKS